MRVFDEKNLILIGIYSTTGDPVALRHFTMMAFNTGVSSAELSIPLIKEVAEALKTQTASALDFERLGEESAQTGVDVARSVEKDLKPI